MKTFVDEYKKALESVYNEVGEKTVTSEGMAALRMSAGRRQPERAYDR